MKLVYLPAYSPDLNPIEEAFSVIKAWLQNYRDYALATHVNTVNLIREIVFRSVTSLKAHGWYSHSGYIS